MSGAPFSCSLSEEAWTQGGMKDPYDRPIKAVGEATSHRRLHGGLAASAQGTGP